MSARRPESKLGLWFCRSPQKGFLLEKMAKMEDKNPFVSNIVSPKRRGEGENDTHFFHTPCLS